MKKILTRFWGATAMLSLLLCMGCDPDPEPEPGPTPVVTPDDKDKEDDKNKEEEEKPNSPLVGEWLQYEESAISKGYGATVYRNDGTMIRDLEILNRNYKIQYEKNPGIYVLDLKKNTLVEQYNNDINQQQTDEYELVSLTDYKKVTNLTVYAAIEECWRVVKRKDATVGDNFTIPELNGESGKTKYLSTNPGVATVDNNGLVKVVKRGRAFIIATTGDRTVAARIESTDPDNYCDDFVKWMMQPIEEFHKVYGKFYSDFTDSQGNPSRFYYIFEDQTNHLEVVQMAGTIRWVCHDFNSHIDINEVEKNLDRKYTLVETHDNGDKKYRTVRNGVTVEIVFAKTDRIIAYLALK